MKEKIICIIIIVCVLTISFFALRYVYSGSDKSIFLKINCGGDTITGTYKVDDQIECNLVGKEFVITIDKINEDKVKLSANNYGLFPRREDGSISLKKKIKKFELEKGKDIELVYQGTDTNKAIVIVWD